MSRPLRLEFPHAVYHVTSRGNARQHIVADDTDRRTLLATLAHVVDAMAGSAMPTVSWTITITS